MSLLIGPAAGGRTWFAVDFSFKLT